MLVVIALSLLFNVQGSSIGTQFQPHSVPYEEIARGFDGSGRQAFAEALAQVGMVTISDIPGYLILREKFLQGSHECLKVLPEDLARGHIFDDGTVRRTMAMLTDERGAREMNYGKFSACSALSDTMNKFRDLVDKISAAFSKRLGEILDLDEAPLLSSIDRGASYEKVEDLFNDGQRLEHVHSYYLPTTHQNENSVTMDFHTDQGLCIAFTPAVLVEESATGTAWLSRQSSGKFAIQLRGGEVVTVDLPGDQLVFMLGDGVNQYVNPRLVYGNALRAVPHALTMPPHGANYWRLWYGRMFLPPDDAMSEHGITYGEMRNELMETWVLEDSGRDQRLALGCSGQQSARELRQLSEDPPCSSGQRRRCSGSCAQNQIQCWWRCMNFTEEVAPDTCMANGYLGLNCTNRRDEISIGGTHHGDFSIACTNSSQPVRPNCALEQISKDRPAGASAQGFENFLAAQGNFVGRENLRFDANNDTEVVFVWKVTNGAVEGVLAFNGMASWMSWGLESIGGGLRGMKGGKVIFGISDMDQEFPELQGTVQEYRIHDVQSRFRFWHTPYENPATTNAQFVSQDGYTALKFTTDAIFGEKLNITCGSNRLMWAIRASTYMHIGKDSYHEGCDGDERTRYRGGGEAHPWIVRFHQTDCGMEGHFYAPEETPNTASKSTLRILPLVGLALLRV